jgi:hypothetical protein
MRLMCVRWTLRRDRKFSLPARPTEILATREPADPRRPSACMCRARRGGLPRQRQRAAQRKPAEHKSSESHHGPGPPSLVRAESLGLTRIRSRRPAARAVASKQERGATAVSAAALPPAGRLVRDVEALAPRSHRRRPGVNLRVAWNPPARSQTGAFSTTSVAAEVSPWAHRPCRSKQTHAESLSGMPLMSQSSGARIRSAPTSGRRSVRERSRLILERCSAVGRSCSACSLRSGASPRSSTPPTKPCIGLRLLPRARTGSPHSAGCSASCGALRRATTIARSPRSSER